MKHMKWWGWGEEGVSFRHNDKPAFAAFVKTVIDIDVTKGPAAVADLESLPVPLSMAPRELRESLQAVVGSGNLKDDPLDRVVHAYGKGLRDLVRLRRGDLGRVNSTIFSCPNGLFLRPLPVPNPSQVVTLRSVPGHSYLPSVGRL